MTGALGGIAAAAPAVAMLAVFALVAGGVWMIGKRRTPTDRTRGILMLVAAGVLLGNVLIWTL